jgi:hypothetical protein
LSATAAPPLPKTTIAQFEFALITSNGTPSAALLTLACEWFVNTTTGAPDVVLLFAAMPLPCIEKVPVVAPERLVIAFTFPLSVSATRPFATSVCTTIAAVRKAKLADPEATSLAFITEALPIVNEDAATAVSVIFALAVAPRLMVDAPLIAPALSAANERNRRPFALTVCAIVATLLHDTTSIGTPVTASFSVSVTFADMLNAAAPNTVLTDVADPEVESDNVEAAVTVSLDNPEAVADSVRAALADAD